MNNGQDWSENTAREVEELLGYTFRDKELLLTAFTHPSYTNLCAVPDNDRLEFLGDSVLGLCVSEKLFSDKSLKAGELTDLRKQFVSEEALTVAEERLNLMRFLRYSGGEDNLKGKTNSNLFEAVVAAIYLDGGLEEARAFILKNIVRVETVNYKSKLQELVQAQTKSTPVYAKWGEGGIKHASVLALGVRAEGSGNSYAEAEREAAKKLYGILTERKG